MSAQDVAVRSRVLIVEDEPDIRDLLTIHLERGGFIVEAVASGDRAVAKIQSSRYDIVILDWMLPNLSGLEVLKTIRGTPLLSELPVLMLTAKSTTSDIVLGLDSGADDYVTKPFEPVVLLARARAILRRTGSNINSDTASEIIVFGDLTINTRSHEVRYQSESIQLTLSEFKLLHALAANRGRVLTRDKLIELVQGSGVAVIDRAIDTHVFGLRKKLGKMSNFIETVRGVGYRINLGG